MGYGDVSSRRVNVQCITTCTSHLSFKNMYVYRAGEDMGMGIWSCQF